MSETRQRILIVEDDDLMSHTLGALLQKFGHEVASAVVSGQEAIEVFQKQRPDLILMDIGLKGPMTGIEASHHIHQIADVPIIYLTAHCDGETMKLAQETGPFGYIVKPFEAGELKIIIQAALYKAHQKKILKEVEKRCEVCLDHFRGITFRSDLNFMPVFVHGPVEKITGYKGESFLQGNPRWHDIVHPEERLVYSPDICEKLKKVPNFSTHLEYRIIHQDQQIRWVNSYVRNICDDTGHPTTVEEIICDITECRELKKNLKRRLKEVEFFHDVTITREHKMIELKREVNELCKELGIKLRYDVITEDE